MIDDNRFHAVPMATYNSAGLIGTYATMNGTGLAHDCRVLEIYNASTTLVTVSLNGVNDHFVVPAGGWKIIDIQTNNDPNASAQGYWHIRKGQILYGKGSAGTGSIYIMGYY